MYRARFLAPARGGEMVEVLVRLVYPLPFALSIQIFLVEDKA